MDWFPQARVDLRTVDLGTELLIYDERSHLVHMLNSTARRIWQLCDGRHSVSDMVDEVARLFPSIEAGTIRGDVERAVAALEEKQVIFRVASEERSRG